MYYDDMLVLLDDRGLSLSLNGFLNVFELL